MKAKIQKRAWAVKSLRKAYEAHMASLPVDGEYDLLEEMPSGTIINHLRNVSLDELKGYIRMVFVDSAPPCFIIRPTFVEDKPKQNNLIMRIYRRFFNE